MSEALGTRRPIRSRSSRWAQGAAAWLAARGVSPDAVSAASVVSALVGGAAFLVAGELQGASRAALLAVAALCVQLRLVCNLLDGLVAVEHGRGGPYGPIWNELPDRVSDALLLLGAGYGASLSGVGWGATAGWLATVLAVLTAYIRELGRGLGLPADFSGPGAKPQRMAVLTAAALLGAAEPLWGWRGQGSAWALALIALLAGMTCIRRTLNLAAALRSRSGA